MMEILHKQHSVVPAPEPLTAARGSVMFNSFAGFTFNDAPLAVPGKSLPVLCTDGCDGPQGLVGFDVQPGTLPSDNCSDS